MSPSPENRARIAFAAFLFVLAAAAAAWYLAVRGQHALYEIRTSDSVSGLIRGAPVEFHGVEVGQVEDVQLVDPRNVRVIVAVRRDVPVTTATAATITGRGLAARGFTGYVYVSLEETAGAGRPLVAQARGDYPVIATAPSQAVSLDTSINQLNGNVQAAVALLRTTLDAQTIASLKRSVANLDQVTRTLAANDARLQSIVANAERTTAQMPPLLQTGAQTLRTMQTELLPQAQQTVTQLDALSGSLADTAERVRRNPALLVRGPGEHPGPGEAR